MKKWSYTGVYILPLLVVLSFNLDGIFKFLPIFAFYGVLPLIELLISPNHTNPKDVEERARSKFYDIPLYMAVPVQYSILIYFFYQLSFFSFTTSEYVGMTLSMGLMCGVFGINIAHELGHRNKRFERLLAELLLLTSLEMHFMPYHNNGHHFNVATPNDPATSRRGELVYTFWFRSQIGSYFQAWALEKKRLQKKGRQVLSFSNKALSYTIIQLLFIAVIYFFYGAMVTVFFIAAALFGILLLETVNYIEHYGLIRNIKEYGRYEKVRPYHSWNSDHPLGRVMLFELSRHSDHHYKASKKYQTLQSFPESPQMPTGYPGMMLFSLIPPLWFKIMNKRLINIESNVKQD